MCRVSPDLARNLGLRSAVAIAVALAIAVTAWLLGGVFNLLRWFRWTIVVPLSERTHRRQSAE